MSRCVATRTAGVVRRYLGRSAFAPHTGQDARAWEAFAHLVELYVGADRPGRAAAVMAMAATLAAAQRARGVHRTFAAALIAIAGGGALAAVWPALDGIPLAELDARLAEWTDAEPEVRHG